MRLEAAERMRPGLVAGLAEAFGVSDETELRTALEIALAAITAELDAAEPTPLPARPRRRVALRR